MDTFSRTAKAARHKRKFWHEWGVGFGVAALCEVVDDVPS